jgi:type I restriction enzyme S subunit
MKLKDVTKYSESRISSKNIYLEQYVTTDSLLPNKQGRIIARNLPPKPCTLVEYSKNDILIGNIRPYLQKIWFADTDGGNSADVLTLQVNGNYNPKFVYYNLLDDSFFEHSMRGAKGSKMPRGDKTQILDYEIPDFPIEKQNNIAAVLSSLDAKIALNRQINDNLEAMAKTVYEYWFVQNADAKWEKKPLGEIANIVNGGTPSTTNSENYGGEIVWITPKDLSNQKNKFTYYGERTITQKGYQSCNTTLIPKGSILLSSRAPIGLLSISKCELCTNQGFKNIVPKNPYIINYLYYYFQQHVETIQQLGAGTTFKEVSKNSLSAFIIPCPTDDILDKWQQIINPIFDKQFLIAKQNQHLTTLRDYLLPLLMNGQVSVNYHLSLWVELKINFSNQYLERMKA